jgi:hypothetical protein
MIKSRRSRITERRKQMAIETIKIAVQFQLFRCESCEGVTIVPEGDLPAGWLLEYHTVQSEIGLDIVPTGRHFWPHCREDKES